MANVCRVDSKSASGDHRIQADARENQLSSRVDTCCGDVHGLNLHGYSVAADIWSDAGVGYRAGLEFGVIARIPLWIDAMRVCVWDGDGSHRWVVWRRRSLDSNRRAVLDVAYSGHLPCPDRGVGGVVNTMEPGITFDRVFQSMLNEPAAGSVLVGDWIYHAIWFGVAHGIDWVPFDHAAPDCPNGWLANS